MERGKMCRVQIGSDREYSDLDRNEFRQSVPMLDVTTDE